MKFFSPAALISTFFGIGKFPFAPGTIASIVATIIVALLFYQPHFLTIEGVRYFAMGANIIKPDYIVSVLCIAAVLIHVIGVWASDKYAAAKNLDDPQEVVIDEVAGIFTSFSLVAVIYAGLLYIDQHEFILYLMLSYYFFPVILILFRIFDIAKPWHVGRADRNLKGGYGIMMDDQIAGLYSAITFFIIFFALKYSGILDSMIEIR